MQKFRNVYVEITNRCNLSCGFCPRTYREARVMSAGEFAHVLDRVAFAAENIYLHVVGEPLLHPEFDKILWHCDQKNVRVKLTTNGTLLKKNLDLICNSSCVRAVNISLSCMECFDNDTAKDYLEDVFVAARILSQNKITTTLRVWVDTKHIAAIVKKIHDNFSVDVLLPFSGTQKICSHLLFDMEKEFVWPIMSNAEETQKNNCLGLRKQLAILSDGSVIPCCLDSEGMLTLGNIFENSLEEILMTEKSKSIAQGFKNGIAVEPFCKKCTFSHIRLKP